MKTTAKSAMPRKTLGGFERNAHYARQATATMKTFLSCPSNVSRLILRLKIADTTLTQAAPNLLVACYAKITVRLPEILHLAFLFANRLKIVFCMRATETGIVVGNATKDTL